MYDGFIIDITPAAVDRYAHFLWQRHRLFNRRFPSETAFRQAYTGRLRKRLEEVLRAGSFGDVVLEGVNSLSGEDEVFSLTPKDWSVRSKTYEQNELFY